MGIPDLGMTTVDEVGFLVRRIARRLPGVPLLANTTGGLRDARDGWKGDDRSDGLSRRKARIERETLLRPRGVGPGGRPRQKHQIPTVRRHGTRNDEHRKLRQQPVAESLLVRTGPSGTQPIRIRNIVGIDDVDARGHHEREGGQHPRHAVQIVEARRKTRHG